MADEPRLTSKKRKVPDADQKKSSRKKLKTTGVVATADSPALLSASSPIPNASSSKNHRQRRPTQRNASPGPSTKPIPQGALSISSTSVASLKKRGRSLDPAESDWSPPSVPSLKSGRVPKPTAKSLASITIPFKPPPIPRKSQMKTPAVKRQKTIPTEVIEILSSEDEALPPVPSRNRRESVGSHPIIRARKLPLESSLNVIDLCSDDDHPTTKSSPVRTEHNVTVILSSDDETRLSSSKAKSRRPTRLIKRTSKAQALLDEKNGVKVSPAGAKGRSVRANKRSRPSKATPASVSATPDPKLHMSLASDNDQNTEGPNNVTNTPTSALLTENEDGREDEGPGLQQAIYDSVTQDAQEHPEDDIVPLEVAREDEGVHNEGNHIAVADNGDTQALSEGLHSLPVQPIPKSAAHSESPPTPARTLHLSSNPNLPLSESASRTKSPSPPISSDSALQPVLDTTSDTEPALQDAVLIWQEGSMENNPAETAATPVEDPYIDMIDPIPPSPEFQDESADLIPNDVENTGTQSPAIAFFPGHSYKNTDEVEDSSALLELPTQFLPENVDSEDKDMGLQNALIASLTQETEKVSGDIPPVTMDMSGNGPGSVPSKPLRYSETIAPDDMSTYLPPHLSHVPSPLLDLYGDSGDDDPDGPPSAVQVSIVEQATSTAVDTLVVGGQPTSIPMMNGSKSWPDEPNATMDPEPNDSALQSGDGEEIEDVQMQRAMFQSLASNTERREIVGPGDEQRATGEIEEELKDDPPPIATPPSPTPAISPLECDSPGDVQKASKSSLISPSPQLSAHSTTPDKPSSSLDNFVSSSEIGTILSHGVRKPPVSFTYSSAVTALPRLLTPSFFAQSFLPPNHQLDSWKTVTATSPVISNALPLQTEPQTSERSRSRSPTPPDVPYALSEHGDSNPNKMNGPEIIPTPPDVPYAISEHGDSDPNKMKGSEIIPMSLEINMQPDSSVQAYSPSITHEDFSSEAAEEVEVDLELTDPESFENVPILAAALSESKILMEMLQDAQQRASGSPAGDHAVNLEHDLPCGMQPQVEESSSVPGSDSSGIQQDDVTGTERDSGTGSPVDDHSVNPDAKRPQVEGKSSESDSPNILQNHMTDVECDNDVASSTGDPAANSQHDGLPGAEMEKAFSPALGSDSLGVQQSDVSGAEGDKDATLELGHINSEQPRHPGKSLSQSSLDSSATTEDSPPPSTPPVRSSSFDFSSFFIRSSSPIDFNDDMLKSFMEISLPSLLDKDTDEDAYLLSTHSFDYPDDIGVV